ncbi:MAG: thiol:disulfide interchange protein DsbA/DsbL [Gammaproteobacteria bacterium]
MFRTLLLTLLIGSSLVAVAEDEFRPGRHYEKITPPVETEVGEGKVEVVEMFWYGCPHCYEFEPAIKQWLEHKPDNIEFVRVPAVFAHNWEIHARAFYAAQQLGILDKTHGALFDALHKERRRLFDEDALATFYAGFGVTEQQFRDAYESFDVDTKVRHAVALTRKYGISGVPAMIVDGTWRTGTQQAGDYENVLKVVDFLAAKDKDR